MKCLFICPDYPPPMVGGSVVYYYYLHSSFSADELIVLTGEAAGSGGFDGARPYKVVRKNYLHWTTIPKRQLSKVVELLRQLFYASRLIREEKIDVIHIGQFYPGAFLGWILSVFTGRPYVLTVMGEDLTGLDTAGSIRKTLVLFALRRAELVLTISMFTKELLLKHGVASASITVLTPGVDLGKCDLVTTGEPRFAHDLLGKKILLTIGRLTERKGQDMVIRALPVLISEFPDIHYVIAGAGSYESRLKSLIDELKLNNYVTIIRDANDEDAAYLYKHCKLFVMPNRVLRNGDTEGFGIVFLEAGWWGKPVIGGNAGGVPDAIDDGVTGILVDGSDVFGIGNAIRCVLGNPTRADAMGVAGKKKAAASNWTEKSEKFKKMLEEVCAQ